MHIKPAPIRNCKLAGQLVDALTSLDLDNGADEEAVITGLVDGYFKAYQIDVAFVFNTLVGAAATIALNAPKHDEECKCAPCILRYAVGTIIQESEMFRAREEDFMRRWYHRAPKNESRPMPDPVAGRAALIAEIVPKEMARIATEHARSMELGDF